MKTVLKRAWYLLMAFAFTPSIPLLSAADFPFQAQWIWAERDNYNGYNDFILARKTFTSGPIDRATLRLTADTRYRLYVNNEWIADGPARGWPHSYPYDKIDVTPYLQTGYNEVRIIANYFGTGTFHQICQEAGLLAQLDLQLVDGSTRTFPTDTSWEVADLPTWRQMVPQKCVQMGPYEIFDARLEARPDYRPAVVRYAVDAAPWQGLRERPVPFLSRSPFALKSFVGASLVENQWLSYGFRNTDLIYPGLIQSNHATSMMSIIATIVHCEEAGLYPIDNFGYGGYTFYVNGEQADREWPAPAFARLRPGSNFLLGVISRPFTHWNRDTSVAFPRPGGLRFSNPLDGDSDNPWCFAPVPETQYQSSDHIFSSLPEEERIEIEQALMDKAHLIVSQVKDAASLQKVLQGQLRKLDSETEVFDDPDFQYQSRRVVGTAEHLIKKPAALMADSPETTLILPSAVGDIELIYDLGEQNCGYYRFDLLAEEGLIIDLAQVEYLSPEHGPQIPRAYRNSMRYICKEGRNRFTSLWRRSGRYLLVYLRNPSRPVEIRHIDLIESTYPVNAVGSFRCEDEELTRLWDISARTLKLCMEDTYTDCPLYEQTLWVGDSRQEALFGMTAFGAHDIARNSILLAAQSLRHFPMVQSQTPSTWGLILPRWSFLWGLMVWDYYDYTGELGFLRSVWPAVLENLNGGADRPEPLLIGAYDAAIRCAEVLNDVEAEQRLRTRRSAAAERFNQQWSPQFNGYRQVEGPKEGLDAEATFLAYRFDIPEVENREPAFQTVLRAMDELQEDSSPVNTMLLMEALEKADREDLLIELIRHKYAPMLRSNATTVWEHFPTEERDSPWPTRSHVHGWSAMPVYFLNRIILGIKPSAPGGTAFIISPRPNGLNWAEGSTGTIHGPVSVRWEIHGESMEIIASAPDRVEVAYQPNDTLADLEVRFVQHP